jgi:hypothetical protein
MFSTVWLRQANWLPCHIFLCNWVKCRRLLSEWVAVSNKYINTLYYLLVMCFWKVHRAHCTEETMFISLLKVLYKQVMIPIKTIFCLSALCVWLHSSRSFFHPNKTLHKKFWFYFYVDTYNTSLEHNSLPHTLENNREVGHMFSIVFMKLFLLTLRFTKETIHFRMYSVKRSIHSAFFLWWYCTLL